MLDIQLRVVGIRVVDISITLRLFLNVHFVKMRWLVIFTLTDLISFGHAQSYDTTGDSHNSLDSG